jgi:hypothetical protein
MAWLGNNTTSTKGDAARKKEQILQVYRVVLRDFGSLKGIRRFSVHLFWLDPRD